MYVYIYVFKESNLIQVGLLHATFNSWEKKIYFTELIPIFYSSTHTIIVGKPVVYSHLNEVILQSSTVWSLLKPRPWRVLPPGGPISMRVVGEDAWLAAWQRRPQPPRSLWRPPFTSVHTIFMQERDFPSENKPRLKRKQSALPSKFLLICQGRRGKRGATRVMDACPSRC